MSNFSFQSLRIADVVLVTPRQHADERGYLMETYEREAFRRAGIDATFVQDNQSLSKRRGTIRGLHLQVEPAAQAKLVSAVRGAIFDVGVDVREDSPTYGQWCGAELTAAGGQALFVPRGFAHGFCTLADDTVVAYKLDAPYCRANERGIAWNDKAIGIDWPVDERDAILSDRDRVLPGLDALLAAKE